MNTVYLGLNALDPASWTTHEVEDLAKFLLETFGDRFPETGKIFHEVLAIDHEVTPNPADPESISRLFSRSGVFYVVVYPAGSNGALMGAAAGTAFASAGASLVAFGVISIAAATVDWLLHRNDKKDIPARFTPITGSPNNVLSERKNTARVLGRIPDIFGDVRAFPDLLQLPYIVYRDHRENEIAYMCVGRGSHIVTDIRDGDMLVDQIEGMSTVVYGPGEIPGGGIPTFTIGAPIADPVYIVKRAEGINGQTLLPPNAFTFIGDIPNTESSIWQFSMFKNDGAGFGLIHVGGQPDEVLEKVKVGDQLEILFPPEHITAGNGLNPFNNNKMQTTGLNRPMILHQAGTGFIPDLTCSGTDLVTVVAVTPDQFYNIRVQIPAIRQSQWDLIDTFTASLPFPGEIGNGGCLITPHGSEWIGPVFVEQSVAPPRDQMIICNFVAQQGLYADDGKTIKTINIRIEIEITPADNNGAPTGDPIQLETIGVLGTFSNRSTRAVTAKIVPVTPGNFLIRARRLTRTPWKQDAPTQYICVVSGRSTGFTLEGFQVVPALALTGPRIAKNGYSPGGNTSTDPNFGDPLFRNSSYLPFKGNIQDEIQWTHCFSLSTVQFISFGDLTTIQTRTIDSRGATQNKDRKLSCLARRLIPTWDGVTFGGPRVQNNMAENVLFTVLTDPAIGNLSNSQIDFPGIAAAFASVRAVMGGPTSDGFGGDEAGQFNYTFDDENLTLEQTIGIICNACFCTPYREGDVIKVRPEIPTTAAEMVVNHRNRVPGTETRNITFGTEAEFDGVELDYVETDINNPTNYAIKTYTIPPNSVASRPKKLQIPGIRTKKMAAWLAWRAYNKIVDSNVVAEVEVCHEAMQLTQMARIVMSDSTSIQIEDGEILAASGVNIEVSQPSSVNAGADYTIALQLTDGSVQTLPVTAGIDSRNLVLGSVPAVPLVVNDGAGIRTLYTIARNDFTPPTAFYVQEKSATGKQTYTLTCSNYSHSFYFNDGLMFWLPIIQQNGLTFDRDWGPYELLTDSQGSAVTDVQRGFVYEGTAVNQHIDITTLNVFASASYTKSSWVKKTAVSQNFPIISSKDSQDEFFELGPSESISGGHNNITYVTFATGAAINSWHMYTLTYDAVTQVMIGYVDGEVAVTATSVPGRPLSNLRIYGQLAGVNGALGRGDDCRYYMRVLTPEEIRVLYQKTRL